MRAAASLGVLHDGGVPPGVTQLGYEADTVGRVGTDTTLLAARVPAEAACRTDGHARLSPTGL